MYTIKFYEYNNKKISVTGTDNKVVKFQMPKMFMPFGVSGFVGESSGPIKWNIDFSLKGFDVDNNPIKKFYENIKNIENLVIDEVQRQSENIFNYRMSRGDILKMFNSNIKQDPDGLWEPKFRVKIDTGAHVFDENQTQLFEDFSDQLYAKNSAIALIELSNVYFMNKKFGITWKIRQLKIYKPQVLRGFMFRDVPPLPC